MSRIRNKLIIATAISCMWTFRVRAADDSAAIDAKTKKAADRVDVKFAGDSTILEITSPNGIGEATISLAKGPWPARIVVRLHLAGLESFSATAGKLKLEGSVSSHSGNGRHLSLNEEGKEDERKPETEIKAFDAAGKAVAGLPSKGGYFEIALPKALFEGQPKSVELSWIDFYRE